MRIDIFKMMRKFDCKSCKRKVVVKCARNFEYSGDCTILKVANKIKSNGEYYYPVIEKEIEIDDDMAKPFGFETDFELPEKCLRKKERST